MTLLVREGDGVPERDYVSLYMRLCRCGGTQPSRTNPKLDMHERDCPYRREIEGDVKEL